MDRIDLQLNPQHIEVWSGVSKMILYPIVRLVQNMPPSCAKINTISK
jgi:hypothetical protein